jgi:hypothetical protein
MIDWYVQDFRYDLIDLFEPLLVNSFGHTMVSFVFGEIYPIAVQLDPDGKFG